MTLSATQTIDTLNSFYDLMAQTRSVRSAIVCRLINHTTDASQINVLKNALRTLKACLTDDYIARLKIDDSAYVDADLTYEITELEKDLFYLENGEEQFIASLESQAAKNPDATAPDFAEQVRQGIALLKGKHFNCFITDRDGTVNNYCGRYRSSVQSVYNAMFLTRFAKNCVSSPIIITSAPLKAPGIVDVSTIPEQTFILAASKGREFINLAGKRQSYPIDVHQQDCINRLNLELTQLVKDPAYTIFTLIGSGLQFKFGQTTIARQDINGSVSQAKSEDFLALVKILLKKADPDETMFRIEDTGLDIEIILTVEDQTNQANTDKPRDFDKADGVRYLNTELNLNMAQGPHLICGDTGSDVPMLEAALAYTKDVQAVFVTDKPELAERVKAVCPNALIVTEPDILVTILNSLASSL
jgi:hypothetical protein